LSRYEVNSSKKKKFDVSDHVLVPKHEVLSQEEKEALLKRYGVKLSQLPKILANDPVVIEIGAKPGDVLRVLRKSLVSGDAVSYRFVIEV